MGYRDDFYKAANIIGYTGNQMESDRLTVYFKCGDEFGRITQYYPDDSDNVGRITQYYPDDSDNVGRNKVRSYSDYAIYNKQNKNGKDYSVEYYNGDEQHKSRNAFVAVPQSEKGTIEALSQAIGRHKELKPKYNR